MDHSVSLLNYKQNLNPMSSVLMSRTISEEFFEVQPNKKKKLYDEAVAELKTFCEGVDLKAVTSLKYHANTWGLSSNNSFADEFICEMTQLVKIDFSDTIHFSARSDLCQGIKSILFAVQKFNI
jgi:hypothetical protein